MKLKLISSAVLATALVGCVSTSEQQTKADTAEVKTEEKAVVQATKTSEPVAKVEAATPHQPEQAPKQPEPKVAVVAPEKPKKAPAAKAKKRSEPEKVNLDATGSYLNYPRAQQFIQEMQAEGFDQAYLTEVISKAERQKSILKAISRPAEKSLNWGEYRKIFIQPKRVSRGVTFWQENAEALARAETEYGVPPEIVVAIIGVETYYGRITGNYRVLDALTTLGFDFPRRSEFFLGQLKQYLHLVKEEQVDITALKGSYAGAMGYGQFIPSSYRNFAVDFDGDSKRDIWSNKTDAIGSVANYFAKHGWKAGEPVISSVSFTQKPDDEWFSRGRKGLIPKHDLAEWQVRGVNPQLTDLSPEEKAILMQLQIGKDYQYWLGLHNFYVITRYNHSKLYAMAVYRLSEQIKAAYEKAEKR